MANLVVISKHLPNIDYKAIYGSVINNETTIVLHSHYYKGSRNNLVPIEEVKRKLGELYPSRPIIIVKAIRNSKNWAQSIINEYYITGGDTSVNMVYFDNEFLFNRFNDGLGHNDLSSMISIPYDFSSIPKIDINKTKINKSFIDGMVYANQLKYPAVVPTVDLGIILRSEPHHYDSIILGKKEGDDFLHFIGGFVDPTDESYEDAVIREAFEETGIIIEKSELKYLGSTRINDWRYGDQIDKIITHLYAVEYNLELSEMVRRYMKPCDDIIELVNFNLSVSEIGQITPLHRDLFKKICYEFGGYDVDDNYEPEDLDITTN